ncbi:MAG: hypothetical protein RIS50_1616, partial [Bacteroidota bacterium]
AYLESMNNPKIRLFDTQWDDTKRVGGAVLADETNKALSEVPHDADWLIYIQADECLHEQYLPCIFMAITPWLAIQDDGIDKKLESSKTTEIFAVGKMRKDFGRPMGKS